MSIFFYVLKNSLACDKFITTHTYPYNIITASNFNLPQVNISALTYFNHLYVLDVVIVHRTDFDISQLLYFTIKQDMLRVDSLLANLLAPKLIASRIKSDLAYSEVKFLKTRIIIFYFPFHVFHMTANYKKILMLEGYNYYL